MAEREGEATVPSAGRKRRLTCINMIARPVLCRVPHPCHEMHPLPLNYNRCMLCLHSVTAPVFQRSSAANTQDFYFCRMPWHNAAIQHRTGREGQKVGDRNNIMHLAYFQNKNKKTVFMAYHISLRSNNNNNRR